MAEIIDTNDVEFSNLLCFEREIINPQMIKKEIDSIIPRLKRLGINHKNMIISRVVNTNPSKKTMTIQIHMPIDVNELLKKFLENNKQYKWKPSFVIKKGVKVVISNNGRDFDEGIKQLMNLKEDFDISNNKIVELSHISFDGHVLGFELFYEGYINQK